MKKIIQNITFLLVFLISLYVLFVKKEHSSKTFYIQGLGEYTIRDLSNVKKIIDRVYCVNSTIISHPVNLPGNKIYNCESSQISLNRPNYFDYQSNEPITIFVTKNSLTSLGKKVLGVSYGNTIYIKCKELSVDKTTLTHEISHTYGLKHCNNNCVMNIHILKIWDDSKDLPIFCNNCLAKLPSL